MPIKKCPWCTKKVISDKICKDCIMDSMEHPKMYFFGDLSPGELEELTVVAKIKKKKL